MNCFQRMFGSMPRISTTSRPMSARRAYETRVVGQVTSRRPASSCGDRRPVDLVVVVVLGVQLGERGGAPDRLEVLDGRRGGVSGVVPALERRDQQGVDQLGIAVELDHPGTLLAVPVCPALRLVGRWPAGRMPVAVSVRRAAHRRLACDDLQRCRTPQRPPRGPRDPGRGRRRRHGHDAAGPGPLDGRLRGARGLQRDPQRHPAGHRPQRARGVLRRRRRRRRDQHLRRQLRQPRASTASRSGSRSSPRPAPGSPARWPTTAAPRTSRAG